ncbi:LysR family transcriptional regulator [Xylophilus sp. GW821-FHT01B05]
MLKLDLQDLRLVVAVADTGSITAGAASVHLAVASASERLKMLEASTGAVLFERRPRGVVPTAAGATLLRHAQAMLGHADGLAQELDRLAQGLQGEVRVAANSVALSHFLKEPLIRFLGENPGVNVVLKEVTSTDALEMVLRHEVAVGISALGEAHKDLQVKPLFVDRLVAVVAPSHPLAHQRQVCFAELLEFDMLAFGTRSALQRFVDAQVQMLGRRVNRRVEVDDLETLCRMAAAGIGVGVMPWSFACRFQAEMGIRLIPLAESWSERRVGAFWSEAGLSKMAERFLASLAAEPSFPLH